MQTHVLILSRGKKPGLAAPNGGSTKVFCTNLWIHSSAAMLGPQQPRACLHALLLLACAVSAFAQTGEGVASATGQWSSMADRGRDAWRPLPWACGAAEQPGIGALTSHAAADTILLSPFSTPSAGTWLSIAAGEGFSCGIYADDKVYCW